MSYRNEIIDILIDHKNGMEVGWLACEVLGYKYPEGVEHPHHTHIMKEAFDMVEEGILQRKNYSLDIAIISIGEIPDNN